MQDHIITLSCVYTCLSMQDEGSFPLLTMDWGAIEEVLLLDAVEQDGLGNWSGRDM